MANKKQRLYAELLDRLQTARKAGFHYEACWFVHAIFEDRTRSIVTNSGDGTGFGGTISDKFTIILDRYDETVAKVVDNKAVRDKRTGKKQKKPKWPNLRTFNRQLIEDVQKWTKSRNDLVHELASGMISLREADKLVSLMSEEGQKLSKELCTAARHVKRRFQVKELVP